MIITTSLGWHEKWLSSHWRFFHLQPDTGLVQLHGSGPGCPHHRTHPRETGLLLTSGQSRHNGALVRRPLVSLTHFLSFTWHSPAIKHHNKTQAAGGCASLRTQKPLYARCQTDHLRALHESEVAYYAVREIPSTAPTSVCPRLSEETCPLIDGAHLRHQHFHPKVCGQTDKQEDCTFLQAMYKYRKYVFL